MAGLESIALAVAHLERAEKESDEEAAAPTNELRQSPTGKPFRGNPRLVSTDVGKTSISKNLLSKGQAGDGRTPGQNDIDDVPFSHTIQSVASATATPNSTTHPGSKGKQQTLAASGRGTVMDGNCSWKPKLPTNSMMKSPPVANTPEQFFRRQISQKILLKCKEEDGPSDHIVANLLARISSVTDNLELLFQLMQELCEHGLSEYGPPKDVPGPEEEITDVGRNDVLSGRGGETNHHYGNVQYRRIVKACQPAYLVAKRRDKPNVATAIVQVIRSRSGRFLKKKDAKSTSWYDVGNTKAREKSSQALREGAPELRSFVEVDIKRGAVAKAISVAQQQIPPASGIVQAPKFVSSSADAVKPAISAKRPEVVIAPKATVVATEGQIKQTAFLQAMQHYKNLYGKPQVENKDSAIAAGKRKADEEAEVSTPKNPSIDSADTVLSETSASKESPPAKRAKVEGDNE